MKKIAFLLFFTLLSSPLNTVTAEESTSTVSDKAQVEKASQTDQDTPSTAEDAVQRAAEEKKRVIELQKKVFEKVRKIECCLQMINIYANQQHINKMIFVKRYKK